MNRISTFALAGLVTLGAANLVEAQQAGQAQQGQSGQAQQGQAGQGQRGNTGSISQTPWFSDQSIRKQLNLDSDRYNQLNKAYGQAYSTYQKGVNQLGNNLSDTDRIQRMQELESGFYKSFSSAAGEAFTDPAQKQRFNELYLQYRGYGAFSDPMVQEKLNLTPEQRQKLSQLNQEWSTQMNDLNRTYQTDREGATKKFGTTRKQYDERLNSILNQQQQQTWHQMTGESANFQPGIYFQGSGQRGQGGQNGQGGKSSQSNQNDQGGK